MNHLKFSPNYKEWKYKFDNEKVYTRRDLSHLLEEQSRKMKVNRVIQSFTGRVGPSESVAMQILAIHETEEGLVIIVR